MNTPTVHEIEVDRDDARKLMAATARIFDDPAVAAICLGGGHAAMLRIAFGETGSVSLALQMRPYMATVANWLIEDFKADQQARAEKEAETAKAEGKVQ